MSLILDALNRTENERKNQNAVPDLNTLHVTREVNPASRPSRAIWWVAGGVLVIVAVIVLFFLVQRREPATSTTSTSAAEKNTPARTPTALPKPSLPVAVEQKPDVKSVAASNPAPVAKTTAQIWAANADVDKLYSPEEPEVSATVNSGVNELYAAEAATTAASETIIDPFNAPGANVVAAQEQAPPRTFESIKNIPDFNALPWNMRQKIPTISYARHNYLDGGVSSVVINNQTTGVGNIIGTGQFVVQEIFVDGVVLKHGNAVFKLKALNGWINM